MLPPQIVQILNSPISLFLLSVLAVWGLTWKGIALWKAAKHSQKKWFIALLLINSFGVLEIIYIFYFQPRNQKDDHK
jgi:hypothetical protein